MGCQNNSSIEEFHKKARLTLSQLCEGGYRLVDPLPSDEDDNGMPEDSLLGAVFSPVFDEEEEDAKDDLHLVYEYRIPRPLDIIAVRMMLDSSGFLVRLYFVEKSCASNSGKSICYFSDPRVGMFRVYAATNEDGLVDTILVDVYTSFDEFGIRLSCDRDMVDKSDRYDILDIVSRETFSSMFAVG